MNRLRLLIHVCLGLAMLLSSACHGLQPLAKPAAILPAYGAPPIVGRVVDLLTSRHTQATLTEVASASTVSLINATTGFTVATTITDANGGFSLNFSNSFRPQTNQLYYLEAVKGLQVGASPNRAGASLARVRTLVFYSSGSWSTLTGLGPVQLGLATTTVAAIAGLRNFNASDLNALLGQVNPSSGAFSPTASMSASDFSTVRALVTTALTNDQDPLESLAYDSVAGQYLFKPSNVVIFDNYLVNGTPSPATASLSAPYNSLTFYGQNFPSSASVAIGPVPVATWSVSTNRTQLQVTIAPTGYSGLLSVTQGSSTTYGPFVPVSGTVGTLAGSIGGYVAFEQQNPIDGTGPAAWFAQPAGLARDSYGNLYVADGIGHVIRRVSPRGVVSTVAGLGNSAGWVDGAPGVSRFNYPWSLAMDGFNNLIVGDTNGDTRIRMVSAGGYPTTMAGNGPSGFADGATGSAQFNYVEGIAVASPSGTIYLADNTNNRVRRISGGTVSTFIGNGTASSSDGVGTAATVNYPIGLALDGNGNLFIAEYGGYVIRRVVLSTGQVTRYAGTGVAGFQDGASSSAQFQRLTEMTIDPAGNLYVVDLGNSRIREIASPSQVVSTVAGTGGGFLDGPVGSALFSNPRGIVRDPLGNLYVADSDNFRIRVISP